MGCYVAVESSSCRDISEWEDMDLKSDFIMSITDRRVCGLAFHGGVDRVIFGRGDFM